MYFCSLPLSTATVYVNKYLDQNLKDQVTAFSKRIASEFIEMLKRATWIDEDTRKNATKKASAMGFNIAYPDELTDDAKLQEYYGGLELQPQSLLRSVLSIRKFAINKAINNFLAPILKNDWRRTGALQLEADTFFSAPLNAIGKLCNTEWS